MTNETKKQTEMIDNSASSMLGKRMHDQPRPPPEVTSNNQRICSHLVEREISHTVSQLVSHFIKNPETLDGSDYNWEEDILPLCVQDDWKSTWEEYLLSNEELALDQEETLDYQQACEAVGIDEPFRNEALEHWIVSDWFAGKLAEQGEMVGELLGLTIWGRCTSGQAIAIDRVIERIAKEMEILTGQKNEWSL